VQPSREESFTKRAVAPSWRASPDGGNRVKEKNKGTSIIGSQGGNCRLGGGGVRNNISDNSQRIGLGEKKKKKEGKKKVKMKRGSSHPGHPYREKRPVKKTTRPDLV